MKFKKHYIENNGKRCRVHYSLDNRVDGRKCVTIYGKTCLDYMSGIIEFKNNSDLMTDYFENDRAVLFEDHPHYKQARAVAEDVISGHKQKHYNRLVKIYGHEKALEYAGIQ